MQCRVGRLGPGRSREGHESGLGWACSRTLEEPAGYLASAAGLVVTGSHSLLREILQTAVARLFLSLCAPSASWVGHCRRN